MAANRSRPQCSHFTSSGGRCARGRHPSKDRFWVGQPSLGQFHSTRLRKQQNTEAHQHVGERRKNTDRFAKLQMCAEVADKGWKQRAHPASQVVRKSLSRSTHRCRKKFREKSSHRTECTGGKESQREAQEQHHVIAHGQRGIEQNRRKREHREENESPLSAYPVGQ